MAQGLGSWMEEVVDPVLGAGIFRWTGEPAVQLFEDGFSYAEDAALKLRYDEIVSLELLDLRALLKARKVPQEPVEFAVITAEGRHMLRVPLYWYSTLSSLLNALRKGGCV